jgi:1-acyl-sn-glycerol-3-phosphate acyltransferase
MGSRPFLQRFVVAFFRNPWVRSLWRGSLRKLFGLRRLGLGNVPGQRPLIFVGNHGSHYDGLFARAVVLELLGEEPVSVAWRGVRGFPMLGRAIDGGAFPLILTGESDEDPDVQAGALAQMIVQLRGGRSVVLLGEGRRHDALGRFSAGAAYASLQTGVPIVPFTLRGVQPLWKELPWPDRYHGRVSVHFHRAVDPGDYAGLPWREAADGMIGEVRRRVASAIDYPDAFALGSSGGPAR